MVFLFFLSNNDLIYSFIFGCVVSIGADSGFLSLQRVGPALGCGAQALGVQASVVAAHGPSSCGAWA